MNIIDTIERNFPSLSRQERKVALKVIQQPMNVKKMTISTLAKKTKVSTATVTRFVKKVGCHDFSDLKLKLAEATSTVEKATVPSTLPDQVTDFYNQIITETWKKLNPLLLKEVALLIKNAPRIFIFGLGSSGYNSQEFAQRLMRMGIDTFAPSDSHMMYITSSIMKKGDVLIVLSTSGKTGEINQAVKLAKNSGVKIVSITTFDNSPLANLSNYKLLAKYSQFVDNTRFINSQLGIVYIIDVLSTILLQDSDYRKRYQLTVESMLNRKDNP